MPERPLKQTDFFTRLDKPADVVEEKVETEPAPKKPPVKKNVKTVRMGDNIPTGGRLGGYMSRIDGNFDDPKLDKKWRR